MDTSRTYQIQKDAVTVTIAGREVSSPVYRIVVNGKVVAEESTMKEAMAIVSFQMAADIDIFEAISI